MLLVGSWAPLCAGVRRDAGLVSPAMFAFDRPSRHDGGNGRRHRHLRIRPDRVPAGGARRPGSRLGQGAAQASRRPRRPGDQGASQARSPAEAAGGQGRVQGHGRGRRAAARCHSTGRAGRTERSGPGRRPGGGPATGPSTTAVSSGPTSTGRWPPGSADLVVLAPRPGARRAGRVVRRWRSTAGCSTGAPRPCSSWPSGGPDVPTGPELGRSGGHAPPAHPDGPPGHARPHRRPRHRDGSSARRRARPAIPVRIYRQFGTGIGTGRRREPPPAIVYFHGGGWVTGDLDSHDASCRLLAAVSGCIVVAVDYRLAPEDPFPAAVDDALAAYAWVQRHSDEVGHADGQVGVMGDSAGGNLAAVVALRDPRRSGTGAIRRPAPGGPGPGLPGPRRPARLGVDPDPGRRVLPHPWRAWSSSGPATLPDRSHWESGRRSRPCWPTTTAVWPRPWW